MTELAVVHRSGFTATPRRCKRLTWCWCGFSIETGNLYYSIDVDRHSLPRPDRAHPKCLEGYFERWEGEAEKVRRIQSQCCEAVQS